MVCISRSANFRQPWKSYREQEQNDETDSTTNADPGRSRLPRRHRASNSDPQIIAAFNIFNASMTQNYRKSGDLILAKIDKARLFLAEARTLLQVKQVIALADAARVYGKQIGATIETLNYAAEVRLRAERRLGDMLKDTPKAKGTRGKGRPKLGGAKMEPPKEETLASVGITKRASSRSQELASMPEADFEAALVVEPGKELNHNRVLKNAKVAANVPLPSGKFRVLYADPPWNYGDQLNPTT